MSLFVAVEVPAAVRAAVRAAWPPVQAAAPHLRPTAEASWHLTLVFLSRRTPEPPAPLRDALADLAARWQQFEVTLTGRAATFGRRVLWAAFEPCPPLAALADQARAVSAAALVGTDLEVDQDAGDFTAHLTLARAPRRGPGVPRAAVEAYAGPRHSWRVQHLQLLSSRHRRPGDPYTVEGEWPLGG